MKIAEAPMLDGKLDLRVQLKDTKGRMLTERPYRLHCVGHTEYYEMPAGSQNWFLGNGDLVRDETILGQLNKLPKKVIKLTLEQEIKKLQQEHSDQQKRIAELEAANIAHEQTVKEKRALAGVSKS